MMSPQFRIFTAARPAVASQLCGIVITLCLGVMMQCCWMCPCAGQLIAESSHVIQLGPDANTGTVNSGNSDGGGVDSSPPTVHIDSNSRPTGVLGATERMCVKWNRRMERCRCTPSMVSCRGVEDAYLPAAPSTTEWLLVQRSLILRIQAHAFQSSTRLTRIHIINSALRSLHRDAFVGLRRLRQLLLHGNRLSRLEPGTFKDLIHLRKLDLHNNKLQSIFSGTFQGLPQLHHLMLHENYIELVEKAALDQASERSLISLSLHNNRLNCNCSIRYLIELDESIASNARQDGGDEIAGGNDQLNIHQVQQDERMRQEQLPWQCRTPAALAEKYVRSLTSSDIGCSEPIAAVYGPVRGTQLEGATASFFCSVRGVPRPEIRWTHDGKTIPPHVVGERPKRVISLDRRLYVRQLRISDAGLYTCTARNIAGTVSMSTLLTVKERQQRPTVQLTPRFLHVLVTGTAEFQCRVQPVNPNVQITWLWNGLPVLDRRSAIRDKVQMTSDGVLRILNVLESDEGHITCSARNPAGVATKNANVTVDVPAALERLTVLSALQLMNNATLAAMRLRDRSDKGSVNIADWLNMPAEMFSEMQSNMPEADRDTRKAYRDIELVRIARRLISQGRWLPTGRREQRVDTSRPEFDNSLVTERQLKIIEREADCKLALRATRCNNECYNSKYRTLDGSCNNRAHPEWGGAHTPLNTVVDPVFADQYSLPRGSEQHPVLSNSIRRQQPAHSQSTAQAPPLPNPREVSTRMLSALTITHDLDYTQFFMQWGQFLDHDISLTETMNQEDCHELSCEEQQENWPVCLSIEASRTDPRLNSSTCIATQRSRAMCGTGSTAIFYREAKPRQVTNAITSFIDGSQVYGSSDEVSRRLRDGSNEAGGMLETQMAIGDKGMPPLLQAIGSSRPGELTDCPRPRRLAPGQGFACLMAGDRRINEQLDLTALHIIWFRQHKRTVQQLSSLNRHWGDDKVFHEARKIVGAQLQHVTFTHWLPRVLGSAHPLSPYTGYDPAVNPAIFAAFSTAAFRFGHAMINPIVRRLNASMQPIPHGNLDLRQAFFAVDRIIHEGGVDPLIRGMLMTPNKLISPTQLLTSEVIEHLFRSTRLISEDLGALNIQRGRDHGLPGYNAFRKVCGLKQFRSFDEMKEVTEESVLRVLKELYNSSDMVDLWVGGLLERPHEDARVGPLFACLIARQFTALRDGDRFWHENKGVFTAEQLQEIKKTTLSRVLCDNGDNIRQMPPDVFVQTRFPDGFQQCGDIPQLNLEQWKECPESVLFNGQRRRAGRNLHEAEVTVFGEEGTSIFSDVSPANNILSVQGLAPDMDAQSRVAVARDSSNAKQSTADSTVLAMFAEESVNTWQDVLVRYPHSPLAASIRDLARTAGMQASLQHNKDGEVTTDL
ncbi:peroxidasin-like [Sycon ciliatum]|uniref:peroxidasin-like n=1 Tax=Sycon ciliatum TaxID=27933 RepID=UPI0031F63DF7